MSGYSKVMKELHDRGSIAKMNQVVAEGLAYHQIGDNCHTTVASICKRELQNNDRLPEGFQYRGCRVASPEEYYKWQTTQTGNSVKAVDLSRSNYYLVWYTFSVRENNGNIVEMQKALLVPYVEMFNLIDITGGTRYISAVWHQPGLGSADNGFFVHFPFSKRIKFELESFTFSVDGFDERIFLPYSKQLKSRKGNSKSNLPLIAYWLFCKYGFAGAIRKYTGVDVIVKHRSNTDPDSINLTTHAVVESNSRDNRNEPFLVLVPREHLSAPGAGRSNKEKELLSIIASFIYAYQQNQQRNNFGYYTDLEDCDFWMKVLGYSIETPKGVNQEIEMQKEIEKHLTIEFPRYYCDRFHREMCLTGVTDLEDTYDFMYHIIREIPVVKSKPKSEVSNVYGKSLKTTEYLFSGQNGLARAINLIRWNLTTLADKAYEQNGNRVVKYDSVAAVLNKTFRVSLLMNIRSGHGEVAHLSSASESAIFSITSHAIDQVDATDTFQRKKAGATINLDDPSLRRHASRCEAGNYGYVTKPQPFGLGLLNTYVTLDQYYRVIPNPDPEIRAIVERTQKDLAKRGKLR